jgi:hypothetical protein
MRVVHLKRALADQLRESDFWYDRSPELKSEFIAAFDEAIETIKKAPEGYVMVSPEKKLRRFYQSHFHTAILYQYLADERLVRIVRVHNCSMSPNKFLK